MTDSAYDDDGNLDWDSWTAAHPQPDGSGVECGECGEDLDDDDDLEFCPGCGVDLAG